MTAWTAREIGPVIEIKQGTGRHKIMLRIWNTSCGWTGSLTGGETPHIGGVVLAVPRPSLTGAGISCDKWSIPVPGHKDLEVAEPLAKRICVATESTVTLTAGIHINNANAADIATVSDNCIKIGDAFLAQLDGE